MNNRSIAALPYARLVALMMAGFALTGGVAGCSSMPSQDGLVTGSITRVLPSLPSLPTPNMPSLSAMVPSLPGAASAQKVERVGANLYRVPVADRRIDDQIQRENYVLLRAAEAAREAGGTHFVVVDAEPGGNGPGASTPQGPLIRVFAIASGGEPPLGAVDAGEIIHFFGPNFGRGPATPRT